MIDTQRQLMYRAFGLNVESEVYLPELPSIDQNQSLDVVIQKGELSQLWAEVAGPDIYFVVKKEFVLFQIPGVAIYRIEKGRKITVSPMNHAKEDQVRLYLLGTCMGVLLMQRKVLPLHGSAIAIGGKAYAIVGDSGAGKSTLASAFLKRGYQLISDDVIPVTLSDGEIPVVTPAYPQQKLWQESLSHFGIDSSSFRPIVDRESKFAIPVADQFATKSMPLVGIVELTKHDDDQIELDPIRKLVRLQTLFTHTYRNFLIHRLGLLEWHFTRSAKMIQQMDMFQLRRPSSRFTAEELTEIVLSTLTKEEKR